MLPYFTVTLGQPHFSGWSLLLLCLPYPLFWPVDWLMFYCTWVMSLKHPSIFHIFHVTYSIYSRGVLILITRAVTVQIKAVVSDPEGSHCSFKTSWHPLYTGECLYAASVWPKPSIVLHYQIGTILIAGDFNNVLSIDHDRMRGYDTVTTSLRDWAESYGWVEVWKHP